MILPSDIELQLLRGLVSPALRDETIERLHKADRPTLRERHVRRLLLPFYPELSADQRRGLPSLDLELEIEITERWSAHLGEEASAVLRALGDNGLAAIPLKGTALQWLYGERLYLRPQTDIDIAVRPEDVPRAFDVLQALGWKRGPSPFGGSWESERKFLHAASLVRKAKADLPGISLDLHWHVLGPFPNTAVDDAFRASLQTIRREDGGSVQVFNPTFQLIHSWIHGVGLSRPPQDFVWVADTRFILKESSIKWDEVVKFARDFRLSLLFKDICDFLLDLGLQIPPEIARELGAGRPVFVERLERKVQSRERSRKLLGDLPVFVCHFFRAGFRAAPKPGLAEFLELLRFRWSLPPDRAIAGALLEVAVRRLKGGGSSR